MTLRGNQVEEIGEGVGRMIYANETQKGNWIHPY